MEPFLHVVLLEDYLDIIRYDPMLSTIFPKPVPGQVVYDSELDKIVSRRDQPLQVRDAMGDLVTVTQLPGRIDQVIYQDGVSIVDEVKLLDGRYLSSAPEDQYWKEMLGELIVNIVHRARPYEKDLISNLTLVSHWYDRMAVKPADEAVRIEEDANILTTLRTRKTELSQAIVEAKKQRALAFASLRTNPMNEPMMHNLTNQVMAMEAELGQTEQLILENRARIMDHADRAKDYWHDLDDYVMDTFINPVSHEVRPLAQRYRWRLSTITQNLYAGTISIHYSDRDYRIKRYHELVRAGIIN